jgi:hypothetical protein
MTKFIIADHLRNIIRWVLVAFLTLNLLLSTTVISIIAHEYTHIRHLEQEHIKPEQVCFLGSYTMPFVPFKTGVGWVESLQMRDLLPNERETSETNASIVEAIVWFICFTIDLLIIILFNRLLKRATTKT